MTCNDGQAIYKKLYIGFAPYINHHLDTWEKAHWIALGRGGTITPIVPTLTFNNDGAAFSGAEAAESWRPLALSAAAGGAMPTVRSMNEMNPTPPTMPRPRLAKCFALVRAVCSVAVAIPRDAPAVRIAVRITLVAVMLMLGWTRPADRSIVKAPRENISLVVYFRAFFSQSAAAVESEFGESFAYPTTRFQKP